MDLVEKINFLRHSVASQFVSRTEIEGSKRDVNFGIQLETRLENNILWFTFSNEEESHSVTVPVPFVENGVLLLESNEVRRALCAYYLRQKDQIVDYLAVIQSIFCGKPEGFIAPDLIKRTPFIQQIVYSFQNGNTSTIVYNLQRAIGEVVNRMPLHNAPLNSWVMNSRLIIVDPEFEELRSPEDRLNYQIEKNRQYFSRGWTSIGMSDGSLADKNYILTTDIRKLTPFGLKFHNPQRNLFSTLGMKGDELPNIRSESMQNLIDRGIARKGWNLFTVFADVPENFEDQILVDNSHKDKFIKRESRFQCYGTLRVKKGDFVKKGQTLSISDLGVAKRFDLDADKAKVVRISESVISVGGVPEKVYNVIVSYKRYLRDGVKFTNLHGNKGVIRMKELGFAVNPSTGEKRRIDVLVSAKSVRKRKNFGQILEALLNNVTPAESKPIILKDNVTAKMSDIKNRLLEAGYPEDGKWHAESYVGPLEAVCGDVFWGVIASVENSLWDENAATRRNTRDLRTAGLKFSHVEFRALETRFGKDNPILNEVLLYSQGAHDLTETIRMLKSKRGDLPPGCPTYHVAQLRAVDQSYGTIVPEEAITDTVADEYFEPEGFVMKLPVKYTTIQGHNGDIIYEGITPPAETLKQVAADARAVYTFDSLYVPKGSLRRCWQHDTGKLGLSEVGVLINNIVIMCHRHLGDVENPVYIRMMMTWIGNYFRKVSQIMGTKQGDLSTLGMCVRYPFSAKAVATLSSRLPENTIEIHESMAASLKVKNGDVVLVERFPCLGFMSIRPQKVRVTNDEMCRYTIRVSGNSLCSLGLDFDGDVIYIASFFNAYSVELLRREHENPNEKCYEVIRKLNEKAGVPRVDCLGLDDYNITEFEDLDVETHAALVSKATGVKSHTGPVIALAYNIMRILENSSVADNQDTNVAIEYFLDRVGNTVFKQKHGVKSLHAITMDAICAGDVETLVEHGFDRETSTTIINVIREKARELGVADMASYHKKAKEKGWSSIINRIVRTQNKIYFASRANLEACDLLDHIESPAVDTPSRIFHYVLSGKAEALRTKLDEHLDEKALGCLKTDGARDAAKVLMDRIESMLSPEPDSDLPKIRRTRTKIVSHSIFDLDNYSGVAKYRRGEY